MLDFLGLGEEAVKVCVCFFLIGILFGPPIGIATANNDSKAAKVLFVIATIISVISLFICAIQLHDDLNITLAFLYQGVGILAQVCSQVFLARLIALGIEFVTNGAQQEFQVLEVCLAGHIEIESLVVA